MGFFDTVLEDTSTKSASSGSTGTKKDDQDGSFLIVDDSVKVEDIPDTAVQLFDSPKQEVNPEAEISFFSEPVVSTATESSPEISFFSEQTQPVVESSVSVDEKEIESTSSVSLFGETPMVAVEEKIVPITEVATATTTEAVTDEVQSFAPVEAKEEIVEISAVVPEKNDIYEPLRKAITEYDAILATHMLIATAKDAEIVKFNAQIAEAKKIAKLAIDKAQESSKKTLEERKALDIEMDRVKQMRDLFSAQLK